MLTDAGEARQNVGRLSSGVCTVGYMRKLRDEDCHRKRLPHVVTGQGQQLLLKGRPNRHGPTWKSKSQAETAGAKAKLRRSRSANGGVDSGEGDRLKQEYGEMVYRRGE
jgi:hypothetical protein